MKTDLDTQRATAEVIIGYLEAIRLAYFSARREQAKRLAKNVRAVYVDQLPTYADEVLEALLHEEVDYDDYTRAVGLARLEMALMAFEETIKPVSNRELGAYIRVSLEDWAHSGFEGAEDGYGDKMAAVLYDFAAGLGSLTVSERAYMAENNEVGE